MSDWADAEARGLLTSLAIGRNGADIIAAALRTAYARGVDDGAKAVAEAIDCALKDLPPRA